MTDCVVGYFQNFKSVIQSHKLAIPMPTGLTFSPPADS